MLKIDANYTDFRDDTDAAYPYGKAVPATSPGSIDGTPWRALWFNDLLGARTAIFKKAFGTTARQPSNVPDNMDSSDVLDAILRIIQDALNSRIFAFDVSGVETTIPWGTLGVNFDPAKTYAAVVTPNGNYEEFLPFGTECRSDGLHIYPRRLVDGKIIPGTRRIKWGVRKWGVGKWGEFDIMKVNLQFSEIE